MAKDPAFLFFPGDWLGGTMTFTRSHKGAYMDLLMAQHSGGHMAIQDIRHVLGEKDFNDMWESKLKTKFIEDENGLFYNQKLENEIIKRKKFTLSRQTNLNHKANHINNHMGQHMENGNGNRNDNRLGNKNVYGISFSEDGKSVTMTDGSIQELDLDQLRRMKEGNYLPHYVKKK